MSYNFLYNNPRERSTITYPWVYWDDAFTMVELKDLKKLLESAPLDRATTFGGEGEEIEKIRKSNVKFFHRNSETDWIFDRINFITQTMNERYYNFILNGYEAFQYTTYDASEAGHYDWHMDMAMGDAMPSNMNEPRKLSMTMLLSDDHEGGEFQVCTGDQNDAITVPNMMGRMVFFPSFIPHRVTPVTKGVRKSLVIWVTGPKFR